MKKHLTFEDIDSFLKLIIEKKIKGFKQNLIFYFLQYGRYLRTLIALIPFLHPISLRKVFSRHCTFATRSIVNISDVILSIPPDFPSLIILSIIL